MLYLLLSLVLVYGALFPKRPASVLASTTSPPARAAASASSDDDATLAELAELGCDALSYIKVGRFIGHGRYKKVWRASYKNVDSIVLKRPYVFKRKATSEHERHAHHTLGEQVEHVNHVSGSSGGDDDDDATDDAEAAAEAASLEHFRVEVDNVRLVEHKCMPRIYASCLDRGFKNAFAL